VALGWGIISTGRHVDGRIAPAINAAPDSELIGIYSRSRERAEAYADKHGAMAGYDQLEDLLNDSRIDAVFIASPNSLHPRHTIRSARAGKHVLTEKTMATNLEDAVHMVQACRQNGVKLGVGFHLRQHPFHIQASQLIAKGTIGPSVVAHAQLAYGRRGEEREPWRTGLSEWWTEADLVVVRRGRTRT
jgi:predicted dehydrogenase